MSINQHEESLVITAKNGDTKAFEELYQLYYDKIYALIMMTVKNSADTEDILQLSFIKAWQNISKLSDPKAFNTWLQRIALNESKMMLRKTRPDLSADDEGENGEMLQLESDLLLPQEYAERDDLSIRLRKIIEELSVVQRDTILLYYYNEMSIEEIAQIMECSEGTVKSRLFLARKAIKTEIEEKERKSGEKFYGAVLMPFGSMFNGFVRSQAISPEAALRIWGTINQSIAGAAAASSAGSVAAGVAAKTGLSLGAKIAIGAIAGIALIGGAAFGISQLVKPQEAAAPASAVASTEQSEGTQEADEGTQTPVTEAPTEADYSEAFRAYLTALKQSKTQINGYDWQLKPWDSTDQVESRPVAFADICGDSTPEMIYMEKSSDFTADCSVITFFNGPYTPMKERVDAWAAAGTQYYLFTVKGDKALYCYNTSGDERSNYRIFRYSAPDGQHDIMKKEEYLYRCEDETGTITLQKNGEDVSISTYNAARSEVLNKVDKVLMMGIHGAFMEDDVKAIMESKENISMTYEEAVKYLGGDPAKDKDEKAEINQEYLNKVKGKYGVYGMRAAAYVEITDDGQYVTHTFDLNTGEENNVTAYRIIGIAPVLGGGYNVGYEKEDEEPYITVYMKGDIPSDNVPPEMLDENGRLNTQLLMLAPGGAVATFYE